MMMSFPTTQGGDHLKQLHPLLVIHEAAKLAPNELALVVDTKRYTYLEASAAILALATHLINQGVSEGDLVAIDLPMDMDFRAKHALFLVGAASCSLFGFAKVPDGLDADWLVTVSKKHPEEEKTIVLAPGSIHLSLSLGIDDFVSGAVKDSEQLMLIYTSGTTGAFKAVPITSEQFEGRVRSYRGSVVPLTRLSLIYNSGVGLFLQLEQLSRLKPAMFASNSEEGIRGALDAGHVESLFASPRQLLGLLEISSLGPRIRAIREFGVTGNLVTGQQIALLRSAAPQASMKVLYGANETGAVAENTEQGFYEPDLVGLPLPGAEIQVVDEQGELVRTGEIGIVRTKTPYMASEYHNEIIETAKAFRHGWFYPGDLGYLDERGSLHLSGRASDVINAGGVKINPRQVEERVLSLEGISDCAGVEVMGPSGVSAFGLAVVSPESIDLARLEKLLRSYFPFSHPTIYRQLDELPKNRNGKTDKLAIKALF
jgi:acyl-coenzyme A synthetase/AMP-(fatty) acid ligase